MLAGLIAGSVAAIVASLVSLPLYSPLDSVFNTVTVTIASLIVGMASGILWTSLSASPRRIQYYIGVLAAAFVIVAVIAIVGNTWLERLAFFTIPLSAIVFVLSGVMALSFGGVSVTATRGLTAVLLIAAVALGIGLMGQGDTESGDLSLPERVEVPTAVPTEAATATATPATYVGSTSAGTTAAATASQERVSAGPDPTDTPPARSPAGAATPAASPKPTATPSKSADSAAGPYVVGEGSEITFTVGEVLARFPNPIEAVLRTTELSGQINIDGQPSTIEVDLHSLSSDQQYRDRYVRTRMFPSHPAASFTVDTVTGLPAEFYSGDTIQRPVSGTLNLNGADFPITFDLEVRNDGAVLNVLGRTIVTWEQLNIPVPTARSVVSIEDQIHVQILLIAGPQ